MPPPDPWLASRRFGIVIDAGSSGSRLQIYSWKDARAVRAEGGSSVHNSLPKVEKGTQEGVEWVSKVEPGISTFAESPDDVATNLAPLLEHARDTVPPSLHHETPLFLLATAGMRLLSPLQQANILEAACNFLRFHSHFRLDDPSDAGPCGSSVRIITGKEEGLFGWIAVNYLMGGFAQTDDIQTTYGFLDMGGASTQIAFEPNKEERRKATGLIDVTLRLINGQDIHHQVFVTTWLGYGTNQARERYIEEAISRHDKSPSSSGLIEDPCLPRDLTLESPSHSNSANLRDKDAYTLLGSGLFEQCLKRVTPLLNKDVPCPDAPCLFNGVHVPHIDFSASHFIGVSEYWYSTEHVFGLGGAYDFVQYERAASEFCGTQWSKILKWHERSKEQGRLGGDGELEEDGEIIDIGRWGDKVELRRLQMQCFKSAWLINVLHEGIGLPRIVDVGGNFTNNADKLEQKAGQKGLGKPTFQSLDVVGDTAISWTLGKMVLQASREVPSLFEGASPLSDPLVDVIQSKTLNGTTTLDLNAKESQIMDHFTPIFTPHNLGFSLPEFFFYLTCSCVLLIVTYRLRRHILASTRRFLRKALTKGDLDGADHFSLEVGRFRDEGRFSAMPYNAQSPSLTASSLQRWFRSVPSHLFRIFFRTHSATTHSPQTPGLRHMYPFNIHTAPPRPFTSPALKYQNGTGNGNYAASNLTTSLPPRSSTPPLMHRDSMQSNGHMNHSFYTLPHSRNSSQLNLTTLVPRQTSSRGGSSGQQTPTGGSFHDGD